jgi:hypothetical protein
MKTGCRWVRPLARATALFVGLALLTPQMLAAEMAGSSIDRPIAAAAATKVAAMKPPAPVAWAQEAKTASSSSSKPFFKTTKGAIALVLMAGGITWAAVSRNKDAVHSPAR